MPNNPESNIQNQYRIIAADAGWIDRSARGRILFSGRDAAPFLQALVSNEIAALSAGQGTYATYLTPQGRMIADLRIYHRGKSLLADVAPGTAGALAARLDQLIFAEDVQPVDVTADTAQIGVAGGRAAEQLATALGLDAAAASTLTSLSLFSQLEAGDLFVVRTDDARCPTFDIVCPAAARDDVIRSLRSAGLAEISPELAESLRVDAGRPAFGVDMTSETIPLEAGLLERAISTNKGCYVGQEVIIRVLHRGGGRVAKRLVNLTFAGARDSAPAVGQRLTRESRDVGVVTSAAGALDGDGWIALGYLHRDAAIVGEAVSLADRADEVGVVAALAG
jgi:folate-binding protein YgfZ